MGWKSLAALGIAAFLVFLAATMPATVIAERLESASAGAVKLTDCRGPWWNGSARVTLSPPRAAPFDIDAVHWRFLPARLLAGELALDARAKAGRMEARFVVARHASSWSLAGLSAQGDASAFTQLAPMLAAWRPAGAVTLSAPRLAWDGRTLAGEASLEWRGAATALSDVAPLGSYRMQLQGGPGPAQVTISTLAGPLTVRASGQYAPPADLRLTGEARADAAQAKALEPLLTLIGPRRPDGAHALEWRTR